MPVLAVSVIHLGLSLSLLILTLVLVPLSGEFPAAPPHVRSGRRLSDTLATPRWLQVFGDGLRARTQGTFLLSSPIKLPVD